MKFATKCIQHYPLFAENLIFYIPR